MQLGLKAGAWGGVAVRWGCCVWLNRLMPHLHPPLQMAQSYSHCEPSPNPRPVPTTFPNKCVAITRPIERIGCHEHGPMVTTSTRAAANKLASLGSWCPTANPHRPRPPQRPLRPRAQRICFIDIYEWKEAGWGRVGHPHLAEHDHPGDPPAKCPKSGMGF